MSIIKWKAEAVAAVAVASLSLASNININQAYLTKQSLAECLINWCSHRLIWRPKEGGRVKQKESEGEN